jgi:hypothetical protein
MIAKPLPRGVYLPDYYDSDGRPFALLIDRRGRCTHWLPAEPDESPESLASRSWLLLDVLCPAGPGIGV